MMMDDKLVRFIVARFVECARELGLYWVSNGELTSFFVLFLIEEAESLGQ